MNVSLLTVRWNKVHFVSCSTVDALRMCKYYTFLAENTEYIAHMGTHFPIFVLWHLKNVDVPIIT